MYAIQRKRLNNKLIIERNKIIDCMKMYKYENFTQYRFNFHNIYELLLAGLL